MTPCSECHGAGQIVLFQYPRTCPTCQGAGAFEEETPPERPPSVAEETPMITGGTGPGTDVSGSITITGGTNTLTYPSPSPNIETGPGVPNTSRPIGSLYLSTSGSVYLMTVDGWSPLGPSQGLLT